MLHNWNQGGAASSPDGENRMASGTQEGELPLEDGALQPQQWETHLLFSQESLCTGKKVEVYSEYEWLSTAK